VLRVGLIEGSFPGNDGLNDIDGAEEGLPDGSALGCEEGRDEGLLAESDEGCDEGFLDSSDDGCEVGCALLDGPIDGLLLGIDEGLPEDSELG